MSNSVSVVPIERIERPILSIRGEKVMLDGDLAEIYGVETRILNQAVTRQISSKMGGHLSNGTRSKSNLLWSIHISIFISAIKESRSGL